MPHPHVLFARPFLLAGAPCLTRSPQPCATASANVLYRFLRMESQLQRGFVERSAQPALATWDQAWLRGCRPNAGASPHWRRMPCQRLRGEWAERWPALAQVPGCRRLGRAAQRAAAATRPNASLLLWARPQPCVVVPPNLSVPACGSPRRRCALLGGAITEGGNLFGWLRDILTLPMPDELKSCWRRSRRTATG